MSQHGVLLAVMAGIILSGILAATMSTADSQLLAAASSVSQDLMQHSFGMKMNQRTTMLAARATVIGIAIIGMVLAWDPNSSVFRVVSFAWAGFGAAFGPVMLFSLFWKRANKQGALAGMITGGAVVFIWKYLIAPMGGAWAIYELLPAFLAACIAIVARIARDARAGDGRHRYLRRDPRQIKGKNRRGLRPSLFFVSQME